MKKTLTVNLGGTVYHIDEDAYILLDNYLNNLRYHFRKDEGAEEIVRDIESRIAELFDEALRGGLQVITIKEVEEVIARMGKPEELNGEEDGNPSASNSKTFDSDRRKPADVCSVIRTTVSWVEWYRALQPISAGM